MCHLLLKLHLHYPCMVRERNFSSIGTFGPPFPTLDKCINSWWDEWSLPKAMRREASGAVIHSMWGDIEREKQEDFMQLCYLANGSGGALTQGRRVLETIPGCGPVFSR